MFVVGMRFSWFSQWVRCSRLTFCVSLSAAKNIYLLNSTITFFAFDILTIILSWAFIHGKDVRIVSSKNQVFKTRRIQTDHSKCFPGCTSTSETIYLSRWDNKIIDGGLLGHKWNHQRWVRVLWDQSIMVTGSGTKNERPRGMVCWADTRGRLGIVPYDDHQILVCVGGLGGNRVDDKRLMTKGVGVSRPWWHVDDKGGGGSEMLDSWWRHLWTIP